MRLELALWMRRVRREWGELVLWFWSSSRLFFSWSNLLHSSVVLAVLLANTSWPSMPSPKQDFKGGFFRGVVNASKALQSLSLQCRYTGGIHLLLRSFILPLGLPHSHSHVCPFEPIKVDELLGQDTSQLGSVVLGAYSSLFPYGEKSLQSLLSQQ